MRDPNCFIYRYLNQYTDNDCRHDGGEGVFVSEFHYPLELSIVKRNFLHLNKELSKNHWPFFL